MRTTLRQGLILTTAIIGLSATTAMAAPSDATSPTAAGTHAPATPTSPVAPNAAAPGTNGDNTAEGPTMEQRVNQRITELHSKLQITPAEEADWNKFAQVMRDNARKMDQAFDSRLDRMDSMNALQNMRSYAQLAREHAQDVQALVTPFQALYDKMPQNQKQMADQVFREEANRGAPSQDQHG